MANLKRSSAIINNISTGMILEYLLLRIKIADKNTPSAKAKIIVGSLRLEKAIASLSSGIDIPIITNPHKE